VAKIKVIINKIRLIYGIAKSMPLRIIIINVVRIRIVATAAMLIPITITTPSKRGGWAYYQQKKDEK